MKIIPGEIEAVSRGDMSKSLCYMSVAFSLIFKRDLAIMNGNNIKKCCTV